MLVTVRTLPRFSNEVSRDRAQQAAPQPRCAAVNFHASRSQRVRDYPAVLPVKEGADYRRHSTAPGLQSARFPSGGVTTGWPVGGTMARTGRQYLDSLQDDRTVYVNGEKVREVAHHDAFRGIAQTVASLYDYASDPANDMLYLNPDLGIEGNKVYLIP